MRIEPCRDASLSVECSLDGKRRSHEFCRLWVATASNKRWFTWRDTIERIAAFTSLLLARHI